MSQVDNAIVMVAIISVTTSGLAISGRTGCGGPASTRSGGSELNVGHDLLLDIVYTV